MRSGAGNDWAFPNSFPTLSRGDSSLDFAEVPYVQEERLHQEYYKSISRIAKGILWLDKLRTIRMQTFSGSDSINNPSFPSSTLFDCSTLCVLLHQQIFEISTLEQKACRTSIQQTVTLQVLSTILLALISNSFGMSSPKSPCLNEQDGKVGHSAKHSFRHVRQLHFHIFIICPCLY